MFQKSINAFLIFVLIFVFLVLISAYIIEYVLGHEPCNLCIYERIPYIFSMILIGKLLFYKKYLKITLLIISLIFFSSTILAFYHFGIEQGFFKESLICETNFSEYSSKEQLLENLNKNTVSCKEVNFKLLGLSLAAINSIFSLVLSVIFMIQFLTYEKN